MFEEFKEKDLGREPTQLEVFRRTHLKKKTNESDPDVWVESRTENTNNEYICYLFEFGSAEPTLEESIKIWSEKVAGGKKRGKPMSLVLEIIYDVFVLDGLVLVPRARLRRLTVFSLLLCLSTLQILHVPWHSLLLK
ncbi:putative protein isoform X3 [Capsicum galapagoense]